MGTCTLSTKATVLAVPCDMVVAGYENHHVNTLRLWDKSAPVNLALSPGEYLRPPRRRPWQRLLPKFSTPGTIITRQVAATQASSISL